MLDAINPDDCALLQCKCRLTTLMSEIVNSEMLQIVEVLLRLRWVLGEVTEIPQSVQALRQVPGMVTHKILFELILMLRADRIHSADL